MAYIGNYPAETQTVDFKWQSVQTSAFSAVTGKGYFVNTTSGAITVTLPSSANVGDAIAIVDYAGTFATNNITLTSSLNIEGGTDDKTLKTNREGVTITYADATQDTIRVEASTGTEVEKEFETAGAEESGEAVVEVDDVESAADSVLNNMVLGSSLVRVHFTVLNWSLFFATPLGVIGNAALCRST